MGSLPFRVDVVVQGQVTVLKPVGWLTRESRGRLESALNSGAGAVSGKFVMDLSSSHISDRSALALFPFWLRRLADMGGCLILAAPSGSVLRALKAGRLDKYLPVCDSLAEGLEMAMQQSEAGTRRPVTA